MVEFDFDWIQKIRADIAAVDFASVAGRRKFANILRRKYTARELFLFKEMAPEDWGAQTRADDLTCRKLWDGALEEAQSLIVLIRAHGCGAITQPIVEKEATGEKMPNPEMLFDLPDGMWDLPIVALRVNAARAMEKNGLVACPRSDKGGKHGKTARGWRTQADVAADFSLSAKRIGGRWYGKVTEDKVKDWESRYPDETKREEKSGYHAGLRNCPNPTPEIKHAYWVAAANWNAYWKEHNSAFAGWMKKNPHGTHGDFLKVWQRPGKTVHRNDTDKTTRYGADMSLANALDSGDFDNGT